MRNKLLNNNICTILFVVIIGLSSACKDNLKHCTAGTEVNLKDSKTLSLRLEFDFADKKGMYEFKSKKKEVMFAIRLALREHESTKLRGRGKRNVHNAIRNICRQLLDAKVVKVEILEYNFKDR